MYPPSKNQDKISQRLARCQKCFAILPELKNQQGQIYCPVCKVKYILHGNLPALEAIPLHFRAQGLYINDLAGIFVHYERLKYIGDRVQQNSPDYPPLRGLLATLKQAQQFVHVITWGIGTELLFSLKMAAQSVPVCVIVSVSPDQTWILSELENYKNEAPNLEIKTVCPTSPNWDDLPHQKLVVIDGLVAFKGSANLKPSAWRKAARGYDEVEVITDVEKVINLHNRLFSPIWADLSDYGDSIDIPV